MTTVARQLKTLARAVAPPPVRNAWGRVYGGVKIRRARRAFADAGAPDGAFLPPAVPFGSKQWPALITAGTGPAAIADLH